MLLHQLLSLLLFPALIAGNAVLPNGRIIGGIPVDVKDYPYQVSVDLATYHFCGGSIVSESFIVAAGHCIYSYDAVPMNVRVNTSLLEEGGTVIPVKNRFLHPQYDPNLLDYDICVLELAEPLAFGDGVQPIALPESGERLENRTLLTVSGWGAVSENDANYTQSPVLLAVNVSSYTNEECKAVYDAIDLIPVTDRMICGNTPEGGHNSCKGDSGGPVVHDGVLYGVVSWAQGCAEAEYPTVYGSVANPSMREFVKNITGI